MPALTRKTLWAGGLILLLAAALSVRQWRAHALPRYLPLSDGTQAFFSSDSKVTPVSRYPQPREIAVDGDVFLRVPARAEPLTARSRLLVLTITGKSALRMIAWSRQAGEQVEVLYGTVTASKNYPSPYKEPDILTRGQMTLINRDIDLMEKETTDLAALQAWSDALVASALRPHRGDSPR